MPDERPPALDLIGPGTDLFTRLVTELNDADLADPSLLPGWTRAHVVGHVARSTDAHRNLLTWARTGVETPAYASSEQRERDIEASAAQDPAALRADLAAAIRRYDEALAGFLAEGWTSDVRRTFDGQVIPAVKLPLMRARELWVHAVDLNAGHTFADHPAATVDVLLDDVAAVLPAKPGCPAARLDPHDRERDWSLGGDGPQVRVTGTAADLLTWVSGRGDGRRLVTVAPEGPLPSLPPWP